MIDKTVNVTVEKKMTMFVKLQMKPIEQKYICYYIYMILMYLIIYFFSFNAANRMALTEFRCINTCSDIKDLTKDSSGEQGDFQSFLTVFHN